MSIFARRHYQFIAEVLGREISGAGEWADTVEAFTEALQRENARFKPGRFRAAVQKARGQHMHGTLEKQ